MADKGMKTFKFMRSKRKQLNHNQTPPHRYSNFSLKRQQRVQTANKSMRRETGEVVVFGEEVEQAVCRKGSPGYWAVGYVFIGLQVTGLHAL